MADTKTAFRAVAEELAACFETARRNEDDPDSAFTRRKDGAPQWTQDLVMDAHGDFLPDDWRYACIAAAAEAIAEHDTEEEAQDARGEFADGQVDVYTHARLAWLASNLNRPGYCDEAAAEFGSEDTASDIVAMIGQGQYHEADEVYGLVLAGIIEQAEAREEG